MENDANGGSMVKNEVFNDGWTKRLPSMKLIRVGGEK